MVKKNVLTPVLAGVLGVTVAGSGVAYVLVNKNADNNKGNEKTKTQQTVVSPKLSVMAENIGNTLSRAQGVASGEVDFAYEGSMNISFGPAVTNMAGTEFKDIGMKVSTTQKGGNEGADITMSYDGKDLVTVNEVFDRANNDEVYLRVPELSDAYLKTSKSDAETYLKDSAGLDLDQYTQGMQDIDFDAAAFEQDMKDYEQVVKDNFPEAKETGTKSGDIDGLSYEYTQKTYDVTSADATKICTAVLEKAKTDETIKKLYDDGVNKIMEANAASGSDEEAPASYEETIDQMLEEVKNEIGEDSDTVTLETYEDANGELKGFTLKPQDDDGEVRYIIASQDDGEGMDLYFDGGDGTAMTAFGSMKSANDAVSGTYTITAKEDDKETFKVIFAVNDVKAAGENFTGNIRFDATVHDGGEDVSGWYEITSDSTADNVDITFDFGFNGENAFTMKVTSSKTEASDVEMPGADSKVYNALDENELNEYLQGCDLEGFQTKMKDALGEELYNSMFGAAAGGYDDDYPEFDPNNVVEDFDDDFDWEQFDLEEGADASTATGGIKTEDSKADEPA